MIWRGGGKSLEGSQGLGVAIHFLQDAAAIAQRLDMPRLQRQSAFETGQRFGELSQAAQRDAAIVPDKGKIESQREAAVKRRQGFRMAAKILQRHALGIGNLRAVGRQVFGHGITGKRLSRAMQFGQRCAMAQPGIGIAGMFLCRRFIHRQRAGEIARSGALIALAQKGFHCAHGVRRKRPTVSARADQHHQETQRLFMDMGRHKAAGIAAARQRILHPGPNRRDEKDQKRHASGIAFWEA